MGFRDQLHPLKYASHLKLLQVLFLPILTLQSLIQYGVATTEIASTPLKPFFRLLLIGLNSYSLFYLKHAFLFLLT